jgi:putative transcriptional regulator
MDIKPKNLNGRVILSRPTLTDPNFLHSIVYIAEHSRDGALGFIINRPSGKTLKSFLSNEKLDGIEDIPVLLSGPVSNTEIQLAAFQWDPIRQEWRCRRGISFEEARSIKLWSKGLHINHSQQILVALLGYAGWSPNQLEKEWPDAWMTCEPNETLLTNPPNPDLWQSLISRHGPLYRALSTIPDSAFLN